MNNHTISSSEVDSIRDYSKIRPTYEQYVLKLHVLLKDIMELNKLKYHSIEGRAKSIESYSDKIKRPGKAYVNPLKELTDLAGIRVIVYYEDDIEKVCNIIKSEFTIDEKRSIDKKKQLSPDQFGYLSAHQVISLKGSRTNLSEWKPYKGLFAEIQIRTVLQHAWASISHALQYKHEDEIPLPLRRKLIRLSGLLELADDQFIELRKGKEAFTKDVTASLSKKDLDIPIDSVSLKRYVETSSIVNTMANIIKSTRLSLRKYDEQSAYKFILTCNAQGIDTIQKLDSVLRSVEPKMHKYFTLFAEENWKHDPDIGGVSGDLLHWIFVILYGAIWRDVNLKKYITWSPEYIRFARLSGKKVFKKNEIHWRLTSGSN